MEFYLLIRMRIVLLGTLTLSFLIPSECKKLDGYEFPVYSTESCPRNQTERKERSSAINCTEKKGYLCLPNKDLTGLLEFCYKYAFLLIEEGHCLYLSKDDSALYSYSCRGFQSGCHISSYPSDELFKHPSCTSIGNGCFLAEPSCKGTTRTNHQETTEQNQTHKENDSEMVIFLSGVLISSFIFCMLIIIYKQGCHFCKRKSDTESEVGSKEELESFLKTNELDQDVFKQWEEVDDKFVSTRACKEVEQLIKSHNLVTVTGNSGSGKSAIIQHIALNYRREGWTVNRITKVTDILQSHWMDDSSRKQIIYVLNDPIGKDSFAETSNNLWTENRENLEACLKKVKCLISSRRFILRDQRVNNLLKDNTHTVDISSGSLKLSNDEKIAILKRYSSPKSLSKDDIEEIVQTEEYFPLLCKLYFSDKNEQKSGLQFFKEPVRVCQEEIRHFRNTCKENYCALVLLVLFNNQLCVEDIRQGELSKEKFELALELSEMKNKAPHTIKDALKNLEGYYVKKIGDSYYFYHDFVMEVTTCVLGTDYPLETIQHADLGFLRRRVKLSSLNDKGDQLTVCLPDIHISQLGERLVNGLFSEELLDVVLNPCLKDDKMIEVVKDLLKNHENQEMLKKLKLQIDKRGRYQLSDKNLLSKLDFVFLENEITPLNALIIFCHTELSLYFLKTIQQIPIEFKDISLFSAVCCNGSPDLFAMFTEEEVKHLLSKKWENLNPIHTASMFHSYEILNHLIKAGADLNSVTDEEKTPLILAAGNALEENEENKLKNTKRDKTIHLLLSSGADINLCMRNRISPLYMACQEGHVSTVELLLNNGAYMNLCDVNGTDPLYTACQNGHINTVLLLLNNGADANSCKSLGKTPLAIAKQNGHNNIVHLLLNNGADANLCNVRGNCPMYLDGLEVHDDTVQQLLSGKDHLCNRNVDSPHTATCQNRHGHLGHVN